MDFSNIKTKLMNCNIRKICSLSVSIVIIIVLISSVIQPPSSIYEANDQQGSTLSCQLDFEYVDISLIENPDPYNAQYLVFPAVKNIIISQDIYFLQLAQNIDFIINQFGRGISEEDLTTSLGYFCGRFKTRILHESKIDIITINHIEIIINDPNLMIYNHEEYSLDIDGTAIHIVAYTIGGVMNALSTLLQIVSTNIYHFLPCHIHDWPAELHRGTIPVTHTTFHVNSKYILK